MNIVRDKDGIPTGIVIGSAMGDLSVNAVIRRNFTLDQRLAELNKDFDEFHAGGVTTHYEGHGMPDSTIDLYTELWKRRGMTMRSYLVKQLDDRKPIEAIAADLDQMKAFSGAGAGDDCSEWEGSRSSLEITSGLGRGSCVRCTSGQMANDGTDCIWSPMTSCMQLRRRRRIAISG